MERMQALLWVVVALLLVVGTTAGRSEDFAIQSFDEAGQLTFNEISTAWAYRVEWAPSPKGPWKNTWGDLASIVAKGSGIVTCSVPMFYRVVATVTNAPPPTPSGIVLIPAGSFQMGNVMDPNEGWLDELPVHTVYVSAFYMDKTEVTKAKWNEVYAWAVTNSYSFSNPGYGDATNHPVHTVNWYDMVKWCNARSQKEGQIPAYYTSSTQTVANIYKAGKIDIWNDWVRWDAGFRLPTEAEWEKAARGGLSGKRFPWGDEIDHTRANYEGDPYNYAYDLGYEGYDNFYATGSYPYTSPVGSFAPNGYGLYDMTGNLWEWCWDRFAAYPSGNAIDPRGPPQPQGSSHVTRGGSWGINGLYCRVAYRRLNDGSGYAGNSIGFRTVLPSNQQ